MARVPPHAAADAARPASPGNELEGIVRVGEVAPHAGDPKGLEEGEAEPPVVVEERVGAGSLALAGARVEAADVLPSVRNVPDLRVPVLAVRAVGEPLDGSLVGSRRRGLGDAVESAEEMNRGPDRSLAVLALGEAIVVPVRARVEPVAVDVLYPGLGQLKELLLVAREVAARRGRGRRVGHPCAHRRSD